MDMLKALNIYIKETGNNNIMFAKKLTNNIYLVNDKEVNIETETIGYPDMN